MQLRQLLGQVGPHEAAIKAQFVGRNRFEGAQPVFPTPLIIMAFTNRCGSHLLADYLRQTGKLAGFGEFLNASVVTKQAQGAAQFPDYICGLHQRLCSNDEVLGIKASYDQILMLLRWNIPAMFTGLRIIHLTRSDAIAQAVSHAIATQSAQWTSLQKSNGVVPRFQVKQIDAILQEQDRANALIRLIAQTTATPRAQAHYEAIAKDPATHVGRLLTFCGIDAPDWVPCPPQVQKQAGAVNMEFVQRYVEQLGKAIGSA